VSIATIRVLRKRRTPRAWPLEKDERKALQEWLDFAGLHYDCNIEGSNKDLWSRIAAKREGMKRGRPDFEIYSTVPGRPEIRGIAIELKRAKGAKSKVSDEQFDKLERLREDGWHATVCYGAMDAIRTLQMLGLGK
jgi:hypothetical protein